MSRVKFPAFDVVKRHLSEPSEAVAVTPFEEAVCRAVADRSFTPTGLVETLLDVLEGDIAPSRHKLFLVIPGVIRAIVLDQRSCDDVLAIWNRVLKRALG